MWQYCRGERNKSMAYYKPFEFKSRFLRNTDCDDIVVVEI